MAVGSDFDDNNFLSLFRDVPCVDDPEADGLSDDDYDSGWISVPEWDQQTIQALPVSGSPYKLTPSGQTDDTGWRSGSGAIYSDGWNSNKSGSEQNETILKPVWLHNVDFCSPQMYGQNDPANFLDRYRGQNGVHHFPDYPDLRSDFNNNGWNSSEAKILREGTQALPASWKKPVCTQCMQEESDNEGGRYRRDGNGDKFFCGCCWRAWDEEARRKMMMAYAPMCSTDFEIPPPEICVDPIVDCPDPDFPDFPSCDEEDEYSQPCYLGDEDFENTSDPYWIPEEEDLFRTNSPRNFNMAALSSVDVRSSASTSSPDAPRDGGCQGAKSQTKTSTTQSKDQPVRNYSLYTSMQNMQASAKSNGQQHVHTFSTSSHIDAPVSVYATGINTYFKDAWRGNDVG